MLASKAGVMKKVMQLMHRWVGGGGRSGRQRVCMWRRVHPGTMMGPQRLQVYIVCHES